MTGRRAILWAFLLIAVGVVLLLREAAVLPENVSWWPIIVFALGVWLLIEHLTSRDRGGGDFVLPLVLMAVGVIFFLQQSGVVGNDVSLWPIVLIAIGIGIVLSALPLGRTSRWSGVATQRASVPIGGATGGRVRVRHGAGQLWIRSTRDPDAFVDGSFTGGVDHRERRVGDELEVTLEPPTRRGGRRAALDWEVGLTRQVPLSLEVDAGANRTDLELSDLTLREVRVRTGASETTITMPAHGRTKAFVSCGAASVRIRIPERTPARIAVRGGLNSVEVEETRFPRTSDGYRSTDFDEGADGVDLTIEAGVASVEVR